MEFELGQTYSGYKFLAVVTRSRNAVQYRVQNTLAQRVESLRALSGAAVDDPDATEKFLREVRIRARLAHPHIVTFYTAVPIEGRMAMTTELPDSVWLGERLEAGPLPWREALDIARQLLEALSCIHQQSFVHCDITPDNILFGPGTFCKLAGFSLARPMDGAHPPEAGAVLGNPRYISPEQVKGEVHLDQRSDLYSLGVVLYEMLCGRPPFESRSQFELMMAHVNQVPVPPSSVHPGVPPFLDAVVLKALAKDSADRYPSAAAFADSIAQVADREFSEPVAVSAEADAPEASKEIEPVVAEVAATGTAAAPAPEAAAELEPVIVEAVAPETAAGTAPEEIAVDAALESVPADTDAVVTETVPALETVALGATPASAPVMADAVVTETVPAPETVALEATPASVPVLADAIVPETATVDAAPESVPVDTDAVVTETVPAPETVALEATPASAPVMADAIVPETATVDAAPESVPVVADAVVTETVPAPETVALEATPASAPATADAIVPETATVDAAPESVPVVADAVETAVVPALEAVAELAPVVAEAVAPEPAAVPAPEPAAIVAPATVPAPEVAPAVAAPDPLHDALWAAAVMVAAGASTHVAPASPMGPAPLPLAPLPPTQPVPLAPASEPKFPAFMVELRSAPDTVQWAVFGGTAAFLGVIWAAIWFAVGK